MPVYNSQISTPAEVIYCCFQPQSSNSLLFKSSSSHGLVQPVSLRFSHNALNSYLFYASIVSNSPYLTIFISSILFHAYYWVTSPVYQFLSLQYLLSFSNYNAHCSLICCIFIDLQIFYFIFGLLKFTSSSTSAYSSQSIPTINLRSWSSCALTTFVPSMFESLLHGEVGHLYRGHFVVWNLFI